MAPRKFVFDESVAAAFDDMATRSIPGYREVHGLFVQMVKDLSPGIKNVLDLGCSVGALGKALPRGVGYAGVDNSGPMVTHAEAAGLNCWKADLVEVSQGPQGFKPFKPGPLGAIFFGWVLQFIAGTRDRQRLLHIAQADLEPGGFVMVAEKNLMPKDASCSKAYYAWREANGYTPEEIAAKTAALKGVMFPGTVGDTLTAMRCAGFTRVAVVHQSFDFHTMVGFKD